MTSAPVKSVNSLVNFVGTKAPVQNTKLSDGSFGSAMSKATGENNNSDAGKQTTLSKCTNGSKPSETSKQINDVKSREPVKSQEIRKTVENPSEQMEKAGQEIADEVAKTLGVTEEEVLDAMEVLGLSYISLLEPGSLQELVLQMSGEADASALLTNEGLFQNLQSLNQFADDLTGQLMQEMNVTPEEMQQLLSQMKETNPEIPVDSTGQDASLEEVLSETEQPDMTIEIKVNGEEVKLSADADGNVTGTVEAASREVKEQPSRDMSEQSGKHGEQEQHTETSLHSENLMLNSVLQDKVSVEETSFAQNISSFDQNTQEIMDQILNYMKIQLKPGMDQLEMQLHPESLGTVHVQLTSKGGEVTAEFHVQNESVKAALETQITELRDNLREQGVKVEAVEVSVDAKGFESNLWQGQERQESYERNKKTPRRINLNELDALFEEEASEEELLNAKVMEMNGNTVDYTA